MAQVLEPSVASARPGGGAQPFTSASAKPKGPGARPARPVAPTPKPTPTATNWSKRPGFSAPWTRPKPPPIEQSRQVDHSPKIGEGSVLEFFFWLFVALALVGGLLGLVYWRIKRREREWESVGPTTLRALTQPSFDEPPVQLEVHRASALAGIAEAIAALKGKDENFSFVVFEDFLYALFVEVHTARGRGEVSALAPYLDESARRELGALRGGLLAVRDVIVGAMRVESVTVDEPTRHVRVEASFTACYTEVLRGEQGAQSFYVVERWLLDRSADVPSREPAKARVIGCPTCGAPLEKAVGERCRYCGQTHLDRDWTVREISFVEREVRGPILTGGSHGNERGTDSYTRVASDAEGAFMALAEEDPSVTWAHLEARIEQVFHALYDAWNTQALDPARPLLSDALYSVQSYWLEAYRAARLRHATSDRSIERVQLSRVARDRYFDAITVRVFASMIDCTYDETGSVVGGDAREPRRYSEYWTLLRGRGHGGERAGCPQCGAPTQAINMAGHCDRCGVKITMGEFSWVLSRIEQDEVYEL